MNNIFQQAMPFIKLYTKLNKNADIPLLASVNKFSQLVDQRSLLKMNLQLALDKCHNTLPNISINQFMQLINTALQEPPSFTLFPLVGGPINTICCELMQTENGRNIFSNEEVNLAIKDMLVDYNKMLKSQKSLKYMHEKEPEGWLSEFAQKHIDYSQFKCDMSMTHYGFNSWNDFFVRQFKTGARPLPDVESQKGMKQIVNSCEFYPIEDPIMPLRGIEKNNKFWLKGHDYSLKDIFGANIPQSQHHAQTFQGGTILQGFLSAFLYHRWHSPVDGVILDNYLIQGCYFLDQSQFTPPDLDSLRLCQTFLSAVATRRIIIIEADNPQIGKIALVYIGMADISSCISPVQKGHKVTKGQYIGHFQIGGSSHAAIFQKKPSLKFSSELYDKEGQPKLQKVNSLLAQLV